MPTELNALARRACIDAGYESPSPEQMAVAIAAVKAGLEAGATRADSWKKSEAVLLACGEMKAQELRTAIAVAGGIAAAIRAMKGADNATH